MPQKLKLTEKVEFGSRSQYDWDTYFALSCRFDQQADKGKGAFVAVAPGDGHVATHSHAWRFIPGDDFDISVESFRNTACTAERSKRFNLKCHTKIEYKLDDKGQQVLVAGKDAEGKPTKEPVATAIIVQVSKPKAGETADAPAAVAA